MPPSYLAFPRGAAGDVAVLHHLEKDAAEVLFSFLAHNTVCFVSIFFQTLGIPVSNIVEQVRCVPFHPLNFFHCQLLQRITGENESSFISKYEFVDMFMVLHSGLPLKDAGHSDKRMWDRAQKEWDVQTEFDSRQWMTRIEFAKFLLSFAFSWKEEGRERFGCI